MTLPNRPRNNALPDNDQIAAPTQLLTPEELATIVDAEYQHVDYDRHPLSVSSLDHYIDNSTGDGRFHISG